MGTNYYLHLNPCPCCGREDEAWHIGKSSGGWCFALHIFGNIETLEDWKKAFYNPETKIVNEYDEEISPEEMLKIITKRSWPNRSVPFDFDSWEEFHRVNHSEPGPNGLLRHKIGDGRCVGHGLGTYDYIQGDFS